MKEASVNIRWGVWREIGVGIKDDSFHNSRNSDHIARSRRMSLEISIWWLGQTTEIERPIRRSRKMWPGRITLHAKDKEPIKDKNSRFVHFLFERQDKIMFLSSERLLLGKRITAGCRWNVLNSTKNRQKLVAAQTPSFKILGSGYKSKFKGKIIEALFIKEKKPDLNVHSYLHIEVIPLTSQHLNVNTIQWSPNFRIKLLIMS